MANGLNPAKRRINDYMTKGRDKRRARTLKQRPTSRPRKKVAPPVRQLPAAPKDERFAEVLSLIASARQRAYQSVNAELVGLYWDLGRYLSQKIASAEW